YIASYEREFDTTRFGKSRFTFIYHAVDLWSTADDAKRDIDRIPSWTASTRLRNAVATSFERRAQYAVFKVAVVRRGSIPIEGATAHYVIFRVTTLFGTYDDSYTWVSSGRLISYMNAEADFGGKLAPADLFL